MTPAEASGPPRTDAERLEQARQVVRGERPPDGNGNVVYAAYVAVIASLTYGVPAARAFFLFVDPAWLSRHLTGVQGVLVVSVILVVAFNLLVNVILVRVAPASARGV